MVFNIPMTNTTNEALVETYWNTRRLLANAANMRKAQGFGSLLDLLDETVAEAHKRGISLTR
jgi:hypothetical protein